MITIDDNIKDKDAQQGAIVFKTLLEACGYKDGTISAKETNAVPSRLQNDQNGHTIKAKR